MRILIFLLLVPLTWAQSLLLFDDELSNSVDITGTMIAKRTGDNVRIVSKYGDDKDIYFDFQPTPPNDIYSFYKIGTINNTGNLAYSDDTGTLMFWARSDNLSPYSVEDTTDGGLSGWIGGSHSYTSALTSTISEILNGGVNLVLDDASNFTDGGILEIVSNAGSSRGVYWFASKGNDTLYTLSQGTGSRPSDIVVTDTVKLRHQTVNSSDVEYFADGTLLSAGIETECTNFTVNVHNELMGLWSINDTTGTGTIVMDEFVHYRVKGSQIEVNVETFFWDTVKINTYYGMMNITSENDIEDYIYMAHDSSGQVNTYGNVNSGSIATYDSVEKVIVYNDEEDTHLALWLDLSTGIPTNTNIVGAGNFRFNVSGKKRFYMVETDTIMHPNESLTWHGSYNFFKNLSSFKNASFGYFQHENWETIFNVDFVNAGTEKIKFTSPSFSTATVEETDANISSITITDNQVKATATGNGNFRIDMGYIGSEILNNNTFDNDCDNWAISNGDSVHYNTDTNSVNRANVLLYISNGSNYGFARTAAGDIPNFTTGDNYVLTFDYYMPSSNSTVDGIIARQGAATYTTIDETEAIDIWAKAEFEFTASSTNNQLLFYASDGGSFTNNTNGDVFYLDNVSLRKK